MPCSRVSQLVVIGFLGTAKGRRRLRQPNRQDSLWFTAEVGIQHRCAQPMRGEANRTARSFRHTFRALIGIPNNAPPPLMLCSAARTIRSHFARYFTSIMPRVHQSVRACATQCAILSWAILWPANQPLRRIKNTRALTVVRYIDGACKNVRVSTHQITPFRGAFSQCQRTVFIHFC